MRLGLFLTPGAARAAYEVGAVQALVNEGGLHFDVVAGCSVGALNGAFVATGQIDRLVEIWGGWRTGDVVKPDWRELIVRGVLWARALMTNEPANRTAIEPYLRGRLPRPETRLRINLADLTGGDQGVFEWPGAALDLATGVRAAVDVPVAARPEDALGRQWVDGLTVDGFPLEELVLSAGVDRAFVIGVAPRQPSGDEPPGAYRAGTRALELNQYSETWLGLAEAEAVNRRIAAWEADREAARQVVADEVADSVLAARLLSELDVVYAEAAFPHQRGVVEIVPILPAEETVMNFSDFDPERSQRLLRQGRDDALAALARLAGGSSPRSPSHP